MLFIVCYKNSVEVSYFKFESFNSIHFGRVILGLNVLIERLLKSWFLNFIGQKFFVQLCSFFIYMNLKRTSIL